MSGGHLFRMVYIILLSYMVVCWYKESCSSCVSPAEASEIFCWCCWYSPGSQGGPPSGGSAPLETTMVSIGRLQVGWLKQVRTTGKHRIKICALYACSILVIRFANILAANYVIIVPMICSTITLLIEDFIASWPIDDLNYFSASANMTSFTPLTAKYCSAFFGSLQCTGR